ncbi:MAG: hypothetical protein Q4G58_14955 [bacterium]|nr:hypothetical protein [bacterium]
MCLSPCELVNMISVITCAIANCVEDEDQIEVLATVFTTLGDSLATYITYKQNCCEGGDSQSGDNVESILPL